MHVEDFRNFKNEMKDFVTTDQLSDIHSELELVKKDMSCSVKTNDMLQRLQVM